MEKENVQKIFGSKSCLKVILNRRESGSKFFLKLTEILTRREFIFKFLAGGGVMWKFETEEEKKILGSIMYFSQIKNKYPLKRFHMEEEGQVLLQYWIGSFEKMSFALFFKRAVFADMKALHNFTRHFILRTIV